MPFRSDIGSSIRLKIAAVTNSQQNKTSHNAHSNNGSVNSNYSDKIRMGHGSYTTVRHKKRQVSTTNSSCCSACTETDSDSTLQCTKSQRTKKTIKRIVNSANKGGIVNSSSAESGSDSSEEDSSDSELHSTPKLKENALIAKAAGVSTLRNEALTADGASSSDMELPALVSAAIQRVESCSDNEVTKPRLANTQYTSSLLREFVAQTQKLGSSLTDNTFSATNYTASSNVLGNTTNEKNKSNSAAKTTQSVNAQDNYIQKKKRGRPRKQPTLSIATEVNKNSESPDSGIISTPQSPIRNNASNDGIINVLNKHGKNMKSETNCVNHTEQMRSMAKKLDIASLERSIYATERILYPPRDKKRNTKKSNRNEDTIDPVWSTIDINKKFRRPSISGYKSDGNTICSKVLAAQSGYISDYGNINQRILSGYKSDYSCKSRRSGYKSDYSIKAKSCGYRSDCSIKHRRKVRRKRRTKTTSSKLLVNDQDILQLAGLSLGQSEESSRDSNHKNSVLPEIDNVSQNNFSLQRKSLASLMPFRRSSNKPSSKDLLNNLCERVSQRIFGLDQLLSRPGQSSSSILDLAKGNSPSSSKTEASTKPQMIRRRRSSLISHCSSRCSNNTRHQFKRRRRKRLKSLSDRRIESNTSDINLQIELLSNSFLSLCSIHTDKSAKDRDKEASISKAAPKRIVKKRKGGENAETITSATSAKRRHKKTVQTMSPDDHKLPLKKRHYLMTPGERSDQKSSHSVNVESTEKDAKNSPSDEVVNIVRDGIVDKIEISAHANSKHESKTSQIRRQTTVNISISHNNKQLSINSAANKSSGSRGALSRNYATKTTPPPGVFEPTEDIELQIPFTAISIPSIITSGKTEVEISQVSQTIVTEKTLKEEPTQEKMVEKLLNRTGGHLVLRKKRKKPNRTGFPTLKKKRKPVPAANQNLNKIVETSVNAKGRPKQETTTACIISTENAVLSASQKKKSCDRVPSEGEAAAMFIERNSRPRLSVVSLDRLQDPQQHDNHSNGVKVETKEGLKRLRDKSEEKLGNKRAKNKKSSVHMKTNREISSDNEPLINLTKKNGVTKVRRNQRSDAKNMESMKLTDNPLVELEIVTKKNSVNAKQSAGVNRKRSDSHHKNDEKNENATEENDLKRRRKSTYAPRSNFTKRITEKNALPPESLSKKSKPLQMLQKEVQNNVRERSTYQSNKNVCVALSKETLQKITISPEKSAKSSSNKHSEEKQISTARNSHSTRNEKSAVVVEMPIISKANKKEKDKTVNNNNIKQSKHNDSAPTESEVSAGNDQSLKTAAIIEIPSEKKVSSKDTNISKKTTGNSKCSNKTADRSRQSKKTKVEVRNKTQEKSSMENIQLIPPTTDDTEYALSDLPQLDENEYMEHEPLPANKIDSHTDTDGNEARKGSVKSKKKYLVAGLFSDYFKESNSNNGRSAKAVSKIHETSKSLLPAPAYCEKYFRQTEIDFCLPYDLYHAHVNGKLPGRNIVHSWNFKKIRTNVYSNQDIKPSQTTDLPQCSCKPESGCGDNCLNRLVYTECSPETCPCGDSCQNTKIQRHVIAPGIERFMTVNKGWGIQTKSFIKKGTYILEYVGEVVTEREFKERMATLYTADIHHYCLHLDGGLVIDGHRMGSDCRFVNHSCSPNCEMQKWSVNGLSRMALFAMRDISPGEELTYDYNFSLFNPAEGQPCKCESEQCRGVIGGRSQRIRPIENKVKEILFRSNKRFQ